MMDAVDDPFPKNTNAPNEPRGVWLQVMILSAVRLSCLPSFVSHFI